MTTMSIAAGHTGISYQQVLDGDPVPPIPALRIQGDPLPSREPIVIGVDRYLSREFADLERQRLWGDTWQFACRRDHIPDVGDHVLYEVADQSIIVVRSGPDRIQAFRNACRHRGTTLVEGRGNTAVFKCPFHGFAWSIDGTFRGMPAAWDFPHAEADALRLGEVAVAEWQGFVFVHPGADPEPFAAFCHPLADHFAQHPLADRVVAHHACQVVHANWKATMEAFLEAYHISTTHGHTIRFANDFDCQYDLFGPNVSRLLQAMGIPATALQGTVPPAEIARTVQKMLPAADRVSDIPDDVDVRAFLGERFRQSYSKRWGVDLSAASDAELLDSIQYFLFPNFAPWMGWSLPIAYRFRPWGDDPGQSLMEIMLLHPVAPGASREPAAEHWLEPGETWTHAPGFEALGMVVDQDIANLHRVQRGMRADPAHKLLLADYQESRIAHFHRRLNRQLGLV